MRSRCLLSVAFFSTVVRGLTTTSSTQQLWSESAVEFARKLSLSEREKLLAEEGAIVRDKPIYIRGHRVTDNISFDDKHETNSDCTITKIVHFQRHGQGYHNLLGEILREAGVPVSIDSTDPTLNPWIRPELVDSPLTETGKWQCAQQQPIAARLNPELVVVSPLLRTLQTAKLSFADFYPNTYDKTASSIPWVAHEACREELGVLTCNRRRPLSDIRSDFPDIDFLDMSEDDTLWNPHHRESSRSKGERIYSFLVDFIANRPETNIAVVTHSAWLFHAMNAVIDCGEDELLDLSSWYLTGEIRSIKVTFSPNDSSSFR